MDARVDKTPLLVLIVHLFNSRFTIKIKKMILVLVTKLKCYIDKTIIQYRVLNLLLYDI